MSINFIVTTPKTDIQSLAHQGIQVSDSFHQIREMVRLRLGDAYALLFAEPSLRADGSAIDWYTPVQGQVRRLLDLPEEEQKTARAALIRMALDIHRIAEEIKGASVSAQVTRGNILSLALQYPDESHIYVVGGQPVFTCWGFGPGTAGALPQNLARLAPNATASKSAPTQSEAPVQPGFPPAAPSRGGISRLWLLPLLLLVLLFFLLTTSFGGLPPLIPGLDFKGPALPFVKSPAKNATADQQKLNDEEAALRAEIDTLEAKVKTLAENCKPQPAPSAGGAVPETAREALVIPEKSSTMEFLRGRWLCDRGLISKADRQPISIIYEFDDQGKGTTTVRQNGRDDCVGSATAFLNNSGVLTIESEKQVCSGGRSYSAEIIECQSGADRAMCLGKSGSGSTWGERVPFYRTQ